MNVVSVKWAKYNINQWSQNFPDQKCFLRSQEPIMLQGNIWSKSTFWMSEWVGCFHSLLKFSEQRSKCSTVYDPSLSSAKQRPNYHFLLFSKSQTTMQCSFTVTSGFGEVSDCSFISFLSLKAIFSPSRLQWAFLMVLLNWHHILLWE